MNVFESLRDKFPELAQEWHPYKNESLTPDNTAAYSNKRVWWYLEYDDPATGKHFCFEWKTSVANRSYGRGCPYLSNKALWSGYNDLQTRYPEIAKEWHPIRNGALRPEEVMPMSNMKVWWYCLYTDPKTGKEYQFEWEASIASRTKYGNGCPYLSNQAVWVGYNDLESNYPELAKEWHPYKNGSLTPKDVSVGSGKKVWWLLAYTDLRTGKHFEFEWKATVVHRTYGHKGCPYLSGNSVWTGYNDLESNYPELAQEWHPYKNGNMTPKDVSYGSSKKVWWFLPYTDPVTGKDYEFEWQSSISNRTIHNMGCPYLSGKLAWFGYNDLETNYPELAKEWHPWRNGKLTPKDVTVSSSKKVWWYLKYHDRETNKQFEFEWRAVISSRTVKKIGCPFITGRSVFRGYNDLASKYPELVQEWHKNRNRTLTPDQVSVYSGKKVWWICQRCKREWKTAVIVRTSVGCGCPFCNTWKR